MSVEGRISVDVLFHDKDGTSAVNVLHFENSIGYSDGSVAYWSGVCGESGVTLQFGPTTYRDASGEFATVQPGGLGRVSFIATGDGGTLTQQSGNVSLISVGNACISNLDEQESISVSALNGTTQYTVVVWSES